VDFMVACTVPGTKCGSAEKAAWLRQDRLGARHALALTLSHVHRNVTRPQFIAVRAMPDPQAEAVRERTRRGREAAPGARRAAAGDDRRAGGQRSWDACSTGRAGALMQPGAARSRAAAAAARTAAIGPRRRRRTAG
jgi:hypothetical protein